MGMPGTTKPTALGISDSRRISRAGTRPSIWHGHDDGRQGRGDEVAPAALHGALTVIVPTMPAW
jgi:hypothetical protein